MSEDNQPYRDFSDAIDAGDGGMASPSPHQPADHNFPVKLHYVLSELEKDGLQDVASWAPHGRCFKVHQTEEFVESVLRRCVSVLRVTESQDSPFNLSSHRLRVAQTRSCGGQLVSSGK
jgi:hypothetical protein